MKMIKEFANSTFDESNQFGVTTKVFMYLGGGMLSMLIISGNILVLLSYYRNKKLQTVTNFYLMSLSITDILLGSISLDFYLIYCIQGRWIFGSIVCNMYLTADYVLYQVAIFHVILICIDRYKLMKNPITYTKIRTKKRVKVSVALAWVLALVIWVPVVNGMHFLASSITEPNECVIEIVFDNWYLSYPIALVSYFIPVILITTFYLKIYYQIKQRTEVSGPNKLLAKRNSQESISSQYGVCKNDINLPQEHLPRKTEPKLTKHRRAARIIIAICLAFTLNLLPYNIQVILAPICKACYSKTAWHVCYVICFINSGINPVCYAWGYPSFRKEFKKILRWKVKPDIIVSSYKKKQMFGSHSKKKGNNGRVQLESKSGKVD